MNTAIPRGRSGPRSPARLRSPFRTRGPYCESPKDHKVGYAVLSTVWPPLCSEGKVSANPSRTARLARAERILRYHLTTLVSAVTDFSKPPVRTCHHLPLPRRYPVLYSKALRTAVAAQPPVVRNERRAQNWR